VRILRLSLRNYRGIPEREVSFRRTGVTVVEGPNETGKSSLAEALDLLFDELDSTTKRAVQAIRPVHRDVGTEIEVDLETGEYAFTYFKRFFKDRATELRITRPRVETLRGREAHERVRAILGETIDEHLWRVLRIKQAGVAGQASLADAAALTRALDKTAGERVVEGASDLFAAVKAEYLKYFTETGQDRKPIKQLRESEARAEEKVRDRDARLAELQRSVERSAELERELGELEGALRRGRTLLAQRQAEMRDLEERRREIETLRLKLTTVETQEVAARSELGHRRRLIDHADESAAERRKLDALLTEREPILREARDEAARLRAHRDAATANVQRADELHELRVRDFEYNRDKLDLTQLCERAAHIEQAQAERAAAQELLSTTSMTGGTLERLRGRHVELERAKAQLETTGPHMHIEALADVEAELDGEHVDLSRGDVLDGPVEDTTVFRIRDVVELRLTPGRSVDALVAARNRAQRELDDLLAEAGVADLGEAAHADAARGRAQETRARSEQTIRTNLRDLTPGQLREKIDRLRKWVEPYPRERAAVPPLLHDFEAAVAAKGEAKKAYAQARDALAAAQRDEDAAVARADRLLEQAKETRGALQQVRREEERAAAELERARGQRADEDIQASVTDAEARRGSAERDYARAKHALDDKHPAQIRALADEAQRAVDRTSRTLEDKNEERRTLAAQLEAQGQLGLYDECEEARTHFEHLHRELLRAETRANGARLLFETMRDQREAARRSYVGPLRDKIVDLGQLVFGDSFTVDLDEGLRVTSRTLDGVPLPLSHLSVGAKEQLAIVSRLACALLVDTEDGVPLIFDDTLGHTDPRRLEAMGAMLRAAGEHCQIIVLTCTPDRFRHVSGAAVIRI
jgi:DNA repair exonuclease SbcCD ATPase subunit